MAERTGRLVIWDERWDCIREQGESFAGNSSILSRPRFTSREFSRLAITYRGTRYNIRT